MRCSISAYRTKNTAAYDSATRSWTVTLPGVASATVSIARGSVIELADDVASSGPAVLLALVNRATNKAAVRVAHSAASSRRLQQASSTDCVLEVNGVSRTFAGCQDVASGFKVFSGLQADGDGNAVLVLGMAALMSGATPGSFWASFGLAPDQQMPGSLVGVVEPSASAASGAAVTGMVIPSYSTRGVNAARGSLTLLDASAEARSDGTLVAVYGIPLNTTLAAAEAAGARPFAYAIGPMDGTDLGSHATGNALNPYGIDSITPRQMQAVSPAASPSVEPAAEPVAEPSPEPLPEPSPEPVPAPSPEPSPEPSPVPAPSPESSPSAAPSPPASSACTLPLDGSNEAYTSCTNVNSVDGGFNLFWTVADEGSNGGNMTMRWALNTTRTTGYVAVGFPTSAGQMVGASAVALAACASCAGGVTATGYYLGGTSQSSVVTPARVALSDLRASALPGGGMAATFTVSMPAPSASRRRRLLADQTQNIILAAGPASSDGSIR